MTKSKWLVAVVAVAMLVGSASAATLNLQTTVSNIKSGTTTLTPAVFTTGYSAPVSMTVTFKFRTIGVPTDEQLANLNFCINKGVAGLTMGNWGGTVLTGAWMDSTDTLQPLYIGNSDAGVPNDLQGIVAEIGLSDGSDPLDPRPTLGSTTAVTLGSVVVTWDGHTVTQLQATPGIPGSNKVFSLYINGVIIPQTGTMNGASISFSPEPVTMVLLAIGGILGLRRRK